MKETELQNFMKGMDLSKICNKRNAVLKEKYKNLKLSDKEIEYRIYQRKYYELKKAERYKHDDSGSNSNSESSYSKRYRSNSMSSSSDDSSSGSDSRQSEKWSEHSSQRSSSESSS